MEANFYCKKVVKLEQALDIYWVVVLALLVADCSSI
jgi:hypothetical protein